MKRRSIAVSAAAIVFGTVLALLMPASPAVGFFSPPLLLDVRVAPTAELVARGAAVELRLDVTCAGADSAHVSATVTQRVGSEVATGSGSIAIPCGPQRQTVVLLVPADSDKAFKKGTAVVEAYINGCTPDYFVCGYETDTQTISIVN